MPSATSRGPPTLAFAAFALALVAAGCIGAQKNDAAAPPTAPTQAGIIAANATTAPDGRGSISAFNETNKTETTGIGAMMHTHDYWAGKTRAIIYQSNDGLIPLPLTPCKKPGCDFTQSGATYPPGTAIADFDIPAPPCTTRACGLVYEGTDHLEILFKDVHVVGTPAAHPYIHIMLDYLTAADEPFAFRTGGQITPGTPFIIPVKPTEADMPHQTKSLWVFRIYTQEANAFDYNITITAVKGDAVANWPPHPNLYAEHKDRTIFDGQQKIESKGPTYLVDGNDAGWQFPDRVISWGTDSIDVTVSDFKYDSQVPVQPKGFILEYHNASYISKLGNGDQAGGRMTDATSDGKAYHFHIATDVQGYDTPYGQKSRWGFRMIPVFNEQLCTLAGTTGCIMGPWSVTYKVQIMAHGHSIDGLGGGSGEPV